MKTKFYCTYQFKIIFIDIKSTVNERRETIVLFVCCKIGKDESVSTPGKGIFPVSCLLAIAWSDKRNCTSTETTETRHALCLKYISGLNLTTGQRSVFYVVFSVVKYSFFFVRNKLKIFKKCLLVLNIMSYVVNTRCKKGSDDGEYVRLKRWNYVLSIFIAINWAYLVCQM